MLKSFSYSALSSYLRCGFAFKCHYVDGMPGRLTGDLIRGNSYHNAVGMALAEKAVYGDYPTLERVIEVYRNTWDTAIKRQTSDEDGKIVPATNIDFGKESPDDMKMGGQLVLEKYYKEYLLSIDPKEVEVWKRIEYKGIPLVSKVDVITHELKIIDHKTSTRKSSEDDLAREYQSSFYAIACGLDELDFELHQAIIKKEPEIKVWPIHRSKADIGWVGELIVNSWQAINLGIFLPNPNGWWCNQQGCNYWSICHREEAVDLPPDDF